MIFITIFRDLFIISVYPYFYLFFLIMLKQDEIKLEIVDEIKINLVTKNIELFDQYGKILEPGINIFKPSVFDNDKNKTPNQNLFIRDNTFSSPAEFITSDLNKKNIYELDKLNEHSMDKAYINPIYEIKYQHPKIAEYINYPDYKPSVNEIKFDQPRITDNVYNPEYKPSITEIILIENNL